MSVLHGVLQEGLQEIRRFNAKHRVACNCAHAGSGSRQDSKPNVTNGGDGSSGQDTGNGNGAMTANGNGGSTAHRLDLPSTAEGAQAGGPLQSARESA